MVNSELVEHVNEELIRRSAFCPAGKKVLGGGAHATSEFGGGVIASYVVHNSSPIADVGWQAHFDITNPGAPNYISRVFAICAFVST